MHKQSYKSETMIVGENGLRPDLMDETREKIRNATNMEKLAQIKILAAQFPNDMDLGAKVRELLLADHKK